MRGSTRGQALALAMLLCAAALPGDAWAWRNDIRIRVAEGRLYQCGEGWDPQHTGRWGNPRGHIEVNGQRVHAYDLRDPKQCSSIVTHAVDASDRQKIVVKVVNTEGSMDAVLTTVAADRVWQVQYFVDQVWGEALSTNWPQDAVTGAERPAAPAAPAEPVFRPRPGQRWRVIETMGTQRWIAEWLVRADGNSFDASWRHEPSGGSGTLSGFAKLGEVRGNQIVIQRPGLGEYTGTLSKDGRQISGRTSWCDCSWTVEIVN